MRVAHEQLIDNRGRMDFVCENRAQFLQDCNRTDALQPTDRKLRIRPRARAPIVSLRPYADQLSLRWVLRSVTAPVAPPAK